MYVCVCALDIYEFFDFFFFKNYFSITHLPPTFYIYIYICVCVCVCAFGVR